MTRGFYLGSDELPDVFHNWPPIINGPVEYVGPVFDLIEEMETNKGHGWQWRGEQVQVKLERDWKPEELAEAVGRVKSNAFFTDPENVRILTND